MSDKTTYESLDNRIAPEALDGRPYERTRGRRRTCGEIAGRL